MAKRVLLTGAAGFVGSHALRHILKNTDWDVVCPATFRHKGVPQRIEQALWDTGLANMKRVVVPVWDMTALPSAQADEYFGHIDYVLNFASESHVDRSIVQPGEFIRNNVALITNLLDWCRTRPEIEGIIHVSTDEVYGPAPGGYLHGEGEPHRPSNPYSASKSAQEAVVYAYWRTYGLPVGITNTMNIIGETQDPEKFVPNVIRSLQLQVPVKVHGKQYEDGWRAGSRFYLHARNQADGVLFALDEMIKSNTARYTPATLDIFRMNVVGEREIHNDEMVGLIAEFMGVEPTIEWIDFHSTRPGHDLRYALDGSYAESLGWKPPVPLDESLRRTVEWTLKNPEWLL